MNRKHDRRSKVKRPAKDAHGAQHQKTAPDEWTDHEHVSDGARIEAQKLIEEAGSPELAKRAIDAVEHRPRTTKKEK